MKKANIDIINSSSTAATYNACDHTRSKKPVTGKPVKRRSIRQFIRDTFVYITTRHNDKMKGLASISTSPEYNHNCQARKSIPGMICAYCYSIVMNKRFKNLRNRLWKNSQILTHVLFTQEEMPLLKSKTGYFRFEAFGDIINEIQVANYFRMAAANPHMKCALWTKNPWIIASAIRAYNLTKPENLTIIGSSYFVNEIMDFSAYDFIDKVFTVYDKQYAKENHIRINCGGRSCAECGRCYENKGGRNVSELVK